MKELFIDASRGLAGDMLSAALLELFPDRDAAVRQLNQLNIPGIRYELVPAESYSVRGSHLTVTFMGQGEELSADGHHIHRGLGDILEIIDALPLSDEIKNSVRQVYRLVADAEAKVHGQDVNLIHFHELGAMDAVADITAACWLIHELKPDRITVSPVCTGYGSVRCAHGWMPVPAPATARLLEGIPCYAGDFAGELCTPTGTALARFFAASFGQMPLMRITAQGYGIGKKDYGKCSCVRTVLGESEEQILELCCNVDDMSPEAVGFALSELLRSGAVDAWYEPIGMKKNRPGLLLGCLCREAQREEMIRLIFHHTTTIGIRETLCRRYVLRRKESIVSTEFGPVHIKSSEGFGVERRKAEYEDLARIARERDLSLADVEKAVYDH